MAPQTQLLMSSGSTEEEPQYTFSLSLKIPSKQTPPGSPTGPFGESCLLTRPFFFFTYLSNSLLKFPQIKKFIPSLKGPKKGASLHVPQKQSPYGNRCPFPEPYLAYLSGSPVKKPPLQVPLTEVPQRETSTSRALHPSLKVPGK